LIEALQIASVFFTEKHVYELKWDAQGIILL